jgi:iron complex transport system permease protein
VTKKNFIISFSIIIILLIGFFIGSILLGYTKTSFPSLYNALFSYSGSSSEIVILTLRIPRAIIALFVGGALAVSGLLMQTVTKNPMASPSLLGINAGASFFVVLIFVNNPDVSIQKLVWVAFIGAVVATLIVFLISGEFKGENNVIKVTLAGAATSALFSSLTQGLLHQNQKSYEEILFWLTGSVEGRSLSNLYQIFPYMLVGVAIAFLLANKFNILILGEDVAISLGQNVKMIKLFSIIAVVLLAGSSVAIAGPISLVGLIIPHILKAFFTIDYKILVPFSFLIGAIFLLGADILSRFIIYPNEAPVGVVTAILGVPFFIYIARRADD